MLTQRGIEKREKALRMAMERMLPEFVKSCRDWRPAIHSSGCIRRGPMSMNFLEWRLSSRDCMGKNSASSGKTEKR